MRDVSRREVLSLVSSTTALAAMTSPSARAADGPTAAPGPKPGAWPITPDRAVVVAAVASGELWAVQDGELTVAGPSAGIVVASIPVKREAVSTIEVSAAGVPDTKVRVDTRPEALNTSLLRIVNKRIALGPKDEPKKLVAVRGVMVDERLEKPLDAMVAKAKKDHVDLEAISAHRAFDYQKKLYDDYTKRDGREAADTYSARPGHSEHQLGLAIDVRGAGGEHELRPEFKDTPAGRWVGAHAHEFGFVLRYPEGATDITGYEPEPWHLRYVGTDVARHLHARQDVDTLEELFGLPAAPGY